MAQRSASPELLAPAGTIDALKLAVNAGADAVYFGVGDFHARRAASGIDVKEAVEYCHLFGAKAYVALNILLKDAEINAVSDVIRDAYKANADAFIVTDLGLLPILNQFAPGVPLHASTQMGISSAKGAEILKHLGFSRVVLARESGLDEIKAVKQLGLEVEYFVHGALCVAFSGSCYFSSVKSGESGNRGLCKQPCRLPYGMKIANEILKKDFYLSPKDQCLVSRLKELKEAGVDSFKIEGRLKRDVYSGGVTEVYRSAIDEGSVDEKGLSALKRLFNRGGFCEGYAFDRRQNLMCPEVQGHIGERIGVVSSVKNGKTFFIAEEPLESTDGFKILRGGREADVRLGILETEQNGYSFRAEGVKVGDEIRITSDADFNHRLEAVQKKLPVSMHCVCRKNQPIKLEMRYRDFSVQAEGEMPEAPKTVSTTEDEIAASLNKLGNTVFQAENTEVETDGVFLPKSRLNELRRNACEALKTQILFHRRPKYVDREEIAPQTKPKRKGIFSEVNDLEKAFAVKDCENSYLVFRPTEYEESIVNDFVTQFRKKRKTQKLFLFTPPMLLERDIITIRNLLRRFDGIIANSLAAVKLGEEEEKLVVLGTHLNISNRFNPLIPSADAYLISVELNEKERSVFQDGTIYAYGRLPLMYFRHCPKITAHKGCKHCRKEDKIILLDGNYNFPLERFFVNQECRFRLLNAVNTDLGIYAKNRSLYLDFGDTRAEDISQIFTEYESGTRKSQGEYTLLHTKRGVL